MKQSGKSVLFIIAVVLVAVFLVSVLGYSTKYGEVTTVVIKGVNQITSGLEFGGSSTITFTAPTDAKLSEEQITLVKNTLEKRLDYIGFVNYLVNFDAEKQTFSATIPVSHSNSDYLAWIASELGLDSNVYFRKGSEESDDSIICTADDVKKATPFANQLYSSYYLYGANVVLDKEGKALLHTATEELVAEKESSGTDQYLTCWYNGESISEASVSTVIKNGKLSISSLSVDSDTITEMCMIMASGTLPCKLTYTNITNAAPIYGSNVSNVILIACSAALAAAFIYMIIKYRLIAAVSFIGMLGTIGGMMLFLTGFMNSTGIYLTLPSLLAIICVIVISLSHNLKVITSAKLRLESNSVEKSYKEAFKSVWGSYTALYVYLLITSIILSACGSDGIVRPLLSGMFKLAGVKTACISSIATFGSVMIVGLVSSYVCSILLTKLMTSSLCSYNKLGESAVYGG